MADNGKAIRDRLATQAAVMKALGFDAKDARFDPYDGYQQYVPPAMEQWVDGPTPRSTSGGDPIARELFDLIDETGGEIDWNQLTATLEAKAKSDNSYKQMGLDDMSIPTYVESAKKYAEAVSKNAVERARFESKQAADVQRSKSEWDSRQEAAMAKRVAADPLGGLAGDVFAPRVSFSKSGGDMLRDVVSQLPAGSQGTFAAPVIQQALQAAQNPRQDEAMRRAAMVRRAFG